MVLANVTKTPKFVMEDVEVRGFGLLVLITRISQRREEKN